MVVSASFIVGAWTAFLVGALIAIEGTILLAAATASEQYFRANVGAVIVKERRQVLAFKRGGKPGKWQFPQGGILAREEPCQAVRREIREETGIEPGFLTNERRSRDLVAYELPPEARSRKTGRGQVQSWFCFTYIGPTNIPLPQDGELVDHERISLGSLLTSDRVVAFRRSVYEKVGVAFDLL